MALENVNNIDTNKIELEFSIAKSVFDAAVDHQFKLNLPKMSIPGFRKGKAPRGMIEKMYGKGVFYEDALNEIIPDAYEEALKESGVDAVSRPEFSVNEINDDGVKMKAVLYVKPEVVLGEYKGLAAEKIVTEATEADIDAEIERLRDRNSRTIDITDRAAQLDDTAVIDYAGTIDGVAFEGGTAQGHELKLGSHSFIDTFEDQIVGHNIDDEFDVNVTFPEEYGAEELAGKPAVFHVVLHGIKATEKPELDDEFAKDVSEFDTLAELREDSRKNIQKRYDESSDNALEQKLVEALGEVVTIEIPQPMIDTEVENIIRDRDYNMRSSGLSLDMYLKYTGMTLDQMREQVAPSAEKNVKTRLALEKIAEVENIEVSEDDINAEFEKMAATYQMEIEKVKEAVSPDLITGDMKLRKALELVKANANITVKTAEEKQAEEAALAAVEAVENADADNE